nr:MAG TPA: hypothetical protein [Caudoviricetes sp.]
MVNNNPLKFDDSNPNSKNAFLYNNLSIFN